MVQISKLNVTSAGQNIDFNPIVKIIEIKNIGSNPAYINLNGVATTNHFKLNPFETIIIGLNEINSIYAICDSTKTTSLNIQGYDPINYLGGLNSDESP